MGVTADSLRLTGRTAVVTGAAAGIGRACATALHALGADVAGCDRDAAGLATMAAELPGTLTRECDVRDPAAVAAFAADVAGWRPRVHVLVNNAGGTFRAGFAGLSVNADESLVRENLLSAVWVTRAFLPQLAGGGSVVNVTSIEAHRASPGFALYGAAKAGLEQLTRTLALELADARIRVNAVAPDVIATPGVGPLSDARPPLGRPGSADEVAGVVAFLAGELASFVTGTTVFVDGGNAAAAGWRRHGGEWAP